MKKVSPRQRKKSLNKLNKLYPDEQLQQCIMKRLYYEDGLGKYVMLLDSALLHPIQMAYKQILKANKKGASAILCFYILTDWRCFHWARITYSLLRSHPSVNQNKGVYSRKEVVIMMRKLLSVFLVLAMIFACASQVYAAETGLAPSTVSVSPEVEERVYVELAEGRITNEEDTLKVALMQYQERQATSRSRSQSGADTSFTITQTLSKGTDANGDEIKQILSTNLLVLDKSNNQVTPRDVKSNSISLSSYQIYAYMSVDYTENVSDLEVRINSFDTTLTYGTSMHASQLIQSSKYVPEPYYGDVYDKTQTINSPSANVAYHYVPNNKSFVTLQLIGCGTSCTSTIKAGTQTATLAFYFSASAPRGGWETAFS